MNHSNSLELRPTRNLGGRSILPLIYFLNCQHMVIKNNDNRWYRVSFILYINYLQKICPPTGCTQVFYYKYPILSVPLLIKYTSIIYWINLFIQILFCSLSLYSPSRTPCTCRLAFLILFHRSQWIFSFSSSSFPLLLPSPTPKENFVLQFG